jgi:hypothetical protein
MVPISGIIYMFLEQLHKEQMNNELEERVNNLYQWKRTITSYVRLIYDQLRELLVDTREHLKVTKDLLNRVEALEKASTKNKEQIQETEQVQEETKEQPVKKKR